MKKINLSTPARNGIGLALSLILGALPVEHGLQLYFPSLLVFWIVFFGSWRDRLIGVALQSTIVFLGHALVYQGLDIIALGFGPLGLGLWGFWLLLRNSWADWKSPSYKALLAWSCLSWVLLALCFPPLPLGLLSCVALVPWLLVLPRFPQSMALRATFWANIPAQLITYYWIANVVQAGYWLAIGGGLFLLMAFLSVFPVILGWVYLRLAGTRAVWLFPVFAVGLEVLRSKGDLSFPWGPISASLGNQLEILQIVAWIGGLGLGLLLYASNLWIARSWQERRWWGVLVIILGLGLCYFWGKSELSQPLSKTETMNVVLFQPNQDQKLKWDKSYFETLMGKMWTLVSRADLKGADLVVLPETSIPNFISLSDPWPLRYDSLARQYSIPILLGVLDYEYDETQAHSARFYNTGTLMDPIQKDWVSYSKVRLVPFSEALPFGKIFPVINFVDFGEGDFSPGPGAQIFGSGSRLWSPNICYEIVYSDFVRSQVALGSRLMVELTNDGWFGRSTQPWQHFNLVRLRAVENGMPVVRATNTGITAALDQKGRILAMIEPHQEGVLRVEVPLRQGYTWFALYGAWVEWAMLILGLAVAMYCCWTQFKARRKLARRT